MCTNEYSRQTGCGCLESHGEPKHCIHHRHGKCTKSGEAKRIIVLEYEVKCGKHGGKGVWTKVKHVRKVI